VLVGVVRRQQRADVDVERKQVANGVRVFGPVQAMERRASRVRMLRGSTVQPCFEG